MPTPPLDEDQVHPEAIMPSPLSINIRTVQKRKTASAQIRGASIEVVLPKHWPKSFQTQVTHQLTQRLQRQFLRDYQLLQSDHGPTLSFNQKKSLAEWVFELNQRTFRVPVKGVRIGHAKYSRLAQMNLKTQMMTVSQYCLNQVPESALTYLVLHELAHLKVPNHSRDFWEEVKRFIPDLNHQKRLIAAVHRVRIYEAELEKLQATQIKKETGVLKPKHLPLEKEASVLKQLLIKLF